MASDNLLGVATRWDEFCMSHSATTIYENGDHCVCSAEACGPEVFSLTGALEPEDEFDPRRAFGTTDCSLLVRGEHAREIQSIGASSITSRRCSYGRAASEMLRFGCT